MMKRRKPDTQQDKKIEEDPKQITEEELHRRKQIMEETQTTWEAPQEAKIKVQMEGDSMVVTRWIAGGWKAYKKETMKRLRCYRTSYVS